MQSVLFFLQAGVAGAERVTVTIGKMLDRTKYKVKFCLIGKDISHCPIEAFIPEEYDIIRMKRKSPVRLAYDVIRLIKQEKPNVVFSSMMFINTKLLAFSWLFPDTRFVIRNNNYLYTLTKGQKLLLELTYRFADYIVAQTDEMRDELIREIRLNPQKVVTLQNPIDTDTIDAKKDEISPYPEAGKKVYIASGRFYHVKGFDILVDAFKKVIDAQPDSELYIIGKNVDNCAAYYNKIQNRIAALGIGEHVHCEGFQTNPYKYVKNADCFVLSSRNEGLPNVLIESLYLGTPVAATTCIPVIERIVEDGKNGYLAESENPDSLAKAMLNAVQLGRVTSSYCSAGIKEFVKLFE